MQKNIGLSDRLVRLAIAVILFAYAWKYSSIVALCFGVFTLYEVLTSWCVLYQLLGKNSCKINKKNK